jgi:NADH:ubiquinone oxidoreductase subunit 6 (subunit J)
MNWIRKAPTAVIVSVVILAGVVTLAFLAGFVVLTINGEDTTEYRGLINLFMNAVTVVLAGVAAIGGTSAARSSSNAEDQTNGTLIARDQKIAVLEQELKNARRAGGR